MYKKKRFNTIAAAALAPCVTGKCDKIVFGSTHRLNHLVSWGTGSSVACFTKEVNPQLAKRPLKTNGRLANLGLTSLAK